MKLYLYILILILVGMGVGIWYVNREPPVPPYSIVFPKGASEYNMYVCREGKESMLCPPLEQMLPGKHETLGFTPPQGHIHEL